MNKLFYLFLAVLLLLCALASCNAESDATHDGSDSHQSASSSNATDKSESTEASEKTNASVNEETNTDINGKKEPFEKNGNDIFFAVSKNPNTFYPRLCEYEEITECFEIPKDERGYYRPGVFLKIINGYDELKVCIRAKDIDKKLFEDNYVICIRQLFWGHREEKRFVGYYDLKKTDESYDISLDYYESVDHSIRLDVSVPNFHTDYIVVPKQTIEYTEEILEITVNGRSDLEGEYFAEEGFLESETETDGEYFNEGIKFSHSCISQSNSVPLPSDPTSWVVKKGSDFTKQYGFEEYGKYSEREYILVLYLPNEPGCDFIIKNREIINGDLYVSVDLYTAYTNKYLDENDVKLYDLNVEDTRELKQNYNVYVTVTEKSAAEVTANKLISAEDAYYIAHEHFLENYYDEAKPYIGIIGVPFNTELSCEEYKIDGWYVELGNINEKNDTVVLGYYVISKYGEIIEVYEGLLS